MWNNHNYWPGYASNFGPWRNYPQLPRGRPGARAAGPYWDIRMGHRPVRPPAVPLRQLQQIPGISLRGPRPYEGPQRPRMINAQPDEEGTENAGSSSGDMGMYTGQQIAPPNSAALNFAEETHGRYGIRPANSMTEPLKVKYEVSSMEATVSWNRIMQNREDFCYQVSISGHKNAEFEFPAYKTFCKMQVKPGTWYRVQVRVVESSGRNVVDEETVNFKSIFSRQELIELYQRAATFAASQSRVPRQPSASMVEITYFYRNKPDLYWQSSVWPNGGIMAAYQKDENGQPANPINSEIKGLFFAGRLMNGALPAASIYGNRRFLIHCCRLFHPDTRLYFSDFYCNFRTHYVTLVLCLKNAPADKFCQRSLVELNMRDNIFLKIEDCPDYACGFKVFLNNDIWIEILYTDDIDLRYGHFDEVRPMGKGTSTPGGLPNNKYCRVCNLYPEETPVSERGTGAVEKEPAKKRKIDEVSAGDTSIDETDDDHYDDKAHTRSEENAASGGKFSGPAKKMAKPDLSVDTTGTGKLSDDAVPGPEPSPAAGQEYFDETMPDYVQPEQTVADSMHNASMVEKFYTSTYNQVKKWLQANSGPMGPTSLELDISGLICRLVDSVVQDVASGVATSDAEASNRQGQEAADLYDSEVYVTVQHLVDTVASNLEDYCQQVTLQDLEAEAEEQWRLLFGAGDEAFVSFLEAEEATILDPDLEEMLFSEEVGHEQLLKTMLERSATAAAAPLPEKGDEMEGNEAASSDSESDLEEEEHDEDGGGELDKNDEKQGSSPDVEICDGGNKEAASEKEVSSDRKRRRKIILRRPGGGAGPGGRGDDHAKQPPDGQHAGKTVRKVKLRKKLQPKLAKKSDVNGICENGENDLNDIHNVGESKKKNDVGDNKTITLTDGTITLTDGTIDLTDGSAAAGAVKNNAETEPDYSHLFAKEFWSDERKQSALERVREIFGSQDTITNGSINGIERYHHRVFSPFHPSSPPFSPIFSAGRGGAGNRNGRIVARQLSGTGTFAASTPVGGGVNGRFRPKTRLRPSVASEASLASVPEEPCIWDSFIPESWKAQERSLSVEEKQEFETKSESLFSKFSELMERVKGVESRCKKVG